MLVNCITMKRAVTSFSTETTCFAASTGKTNVIFKLEEKVTGAKAQQDGELGIETAKKSKVVVPNQLCEKKVSVECL